MELRRVADALLRSQSSPLPIFLLPSIKRWPASHFNSVQRSSRVVSRPFTSSITQYAIRSSVTTSPAKPTTLAESRGSTKADDAPASLDWTSANLGGNRSNKFGTPRGQSADVTQGERDMNKGSSATDLLSALNIQNPRNRNSSSMFSKGLFDNMAEVKNKGQSDPASFVVDVGPPVPPKIPLRLNPTTGRTVSIGAGIDIARGFRLLEQSCGRNKVRTDSRYQMFHERGGTKRKRLYRSRWRKLFKDGFRATVNRVKELKKQGW